MVIYVPGTEETDPKKQNMSLQQLGGGLTTAAASVATNTADIATANTNIAANTANISSHASSIAAMQAAWTAFTPTITAQTGTFTTVSAAGAYLATGKTVLFAVTITITTVGTATGAIICPLPVGTAKREFALAVRETALTGVSGVGSIQAATATARIVKYDASTLAASGNVIIVSGEYEQT